MIWNADWYAGHTIPGYSVLYPPLGALLGPEWVGAIAALAATALFAALARGALGQRAWLGIIWFGLASTVSLYGGRVTFGLGLAIGLAALLAVQRRRPLVAASLGALSALASPVAGLFTLIAAAAVVLGRWRHLPSAAEMRFEPRSQKRGPRSGGPSTEIHLEPHSRIRRGTRSSGGGRGLLLAGLLAAAGALAALALLALAFPTDGFQPFAFSAYVWIPLLAAAVLLFADGEHSMLRWGALLYLAVATVAVAVETPLGGNAVRLGAIFAGPLLALLLLPRRPVVLALLAVPLLWWQWTATVRDVAAAEGDPSTEAAYYEPLAREIERRAGGRVVRVHVPPTRNRWEAAYLAERLPLARGWLRQLESDDLERFEADLDAAEYRAWLDRVGAVYVALPDAELDRIAESERKVIESGGLDGKLVWRNEHWRLYEVAPIPGSILEGPGRLLELGADGFALRTPADEVGLRVHYTPYFEVLVGDACVEREEVDGEEWTRVTVSDEPPLREQQTIEVGARLSFDALLGRDRSCSD